MVPGVIRSGRFEAWKRLEERSERDDPDRRIGNIEQVGIARHEGVGTDRDRERDEVVVVRVATHCCRFGGIGFETRTAAHIGNEAVGHIARNQSTDLRSRQHIRELSEQRRTCDVVEPARNARLDHAPSDSCRRDCRGDEDVDVENDEHLRGVTALVARGPHLVSGKGKRFVVADADAVRRLVLGDLVHQSREVTHQHIAQSALVELLLGDS